MKKLLTVLAVCLLLVSCASTKKTPVVNPDAPVTEEQAAFAMNYVLTKAQEKTVNQLYFSISQTELLPARYMIMVSAASEIPGLQTVLDKSRQEMSDYILKVLENGSAYTDTLVSQTVFDDPVALAAKSNTSASEFFKANNKEKVRKMVQDNFTDADFSNLEKARNMYNVYIGLMNYFENGAKITVDSIDYQTYYIDLATQIYFDTLSQCEQLIRTTPDPFQDTYITQVLGNW